MSATTDFERMVSSWLEDDGPTRLRPSVVDDAFTKAREVSQRRRIRAWSGGVASWPTRGATRRSTGAFRLAAVLLLVGMLVLAMAAAAAMIGSRLPLLTPFAVVPAPSPIATPGILLDPFAGPTLVYGRRDGGLFVAGADGLDARPILADGWYIHPRLSTDRRWIAADAAGTLGRSFVVLRPDGTVALEFPAGDSLTTFAWGAAGPSAGWLAATMEGSIVVVDPASGSRLTIDTGDAGVRALAWSPDAPVLWWAGGRSGNLRNYDGISAEDVHAVRLDGTAGTLQIADQRSFVLELDPARTARALEQMSVSPDGRTLAFRARIEGWLRSDLILVDADGGAPTYLNPAPPSAPWLTARSGIRWLPDGSGVVAEVGDIAEGAIVRPSVVPIDGTPPRPIDVGRLSVDDGGIVEPSGPVLPSDTAILVGGARSGLEAMGGWQVSVHDLWVADADGSGSHLVATETLGGDLR